jgi:hypothetical protein
MRDMGESFLVFREQGRIFDQRCREPADGRRPAPSFLEPQASGEPVEGTARAGERPRKERVMYGALAGDISMG